MTERQEYRRAIRAFFVHYTDERLAMLLAHARDGKFDYYSCCCFIGIPTARHALRSYVGRPSDSFRRFEFCGKTLVTCNATWDHYYKAAELEGAYEAEIAAWQLGYNEASGKEDCDQRIRILIPMIRAEMKLRANVHEQREVVAQTDCMFSTF